MDQLILQSWILYILVFSINLSNIYGKPACDVSHVVGPINTIYEAKTPYDFSTVNAVLLEHEDYLFDCCGFIDAWDIVADSISVPFDVYVQVWRENKVIPTWNLTGENIITATGTNAEFNIKVKGTRIRVGAHDFNEYVGFYLPNGYILYDNGHSYRETYFASPQASYNWNSVVLGNNRDYAIHAEVVPSKYPTINLDATVIIKPTDSGGSIIFTILGTDDDPEDKDLTYEAINSTDVADDFFEFFPLTHQISIRNGVMLIPGIYNMTFAVFDDCRQSSTGTLTLIIENMETYTPSKETKPYPKSVIRETKTIDNRSKHHFHEDS